MNLIDEYWEARKNPRAFSGPMRRCPSCFVNRNMWHKEDCETQREAKDSPSIYPATGPDGL